MNKNMVMAAITILGAAACSKGGPDAQPSIATEDARIPSAIAALPAGAPASIEAAIRANPDRFFRLLSEAADESAAAGDILILVDKKRSLPDGFEPADLVSLNDYPLSTTRKDLRLRKAIIGAVIEMVSAAEADGVQLVFGSSYRSYEYQDGLFKRYVASHGEAEASRFSARPGTSQHQLGTAMDFDPIDDAFAQTPAGMWVAANAGRFGFSLSFPKGMEPVTGYIWESWHYRYITKQGVLLQNEYFGGIQQYLIEFIALYRKPRA